MKKKLTNLIALLFVTIGFSQNFTVDDLNYEVISTNPNTVKVTGFVTKVSNLVIPSTITDNGIDYTVTTIGNSAFRAKFLTSVSLPTTLTTIEFRAFRDQSKLTSITIPEHVVLIGNEAFFDNGLTEVIVKNSTAINISGGTFGNRSIINLTVPDGTETDYINAGWTSFFTINGAILVGSSFTTDNIIYEVTTVNPNTVKTIGGNVSGDLVIPSLVSKINLDFSVTSIGNSAFKDKDLTSLTIPESIVSIEDLAFFNTSLTKVIAQGSTPATIETNTFNNRDTIDLTIPNSTETAYINAEWTGFLSVNGSNFIIGTTYTVNKVNYEVTNLNPKTVKAIGGNVSDNLVIPSSVNINNFDFSVTSIGNSAFKDKDLTSLTIPESIVSIEDEAFFDNSLTKVIAQGSTPATIQTNTFNNRGNIELTVPNGTETAYANAGWTDFFNVNGSDFNIGTIFTVNNVNYEITTKSPNVVKAIGGNVSGDLVIPSLVSKNNIDFSVTSIGNSAFENRDITSLSLPTTITTIEFRAFRNNLIKSITIPKHVVSIGNEAFPQNKDMLTEVISESTTPPIIITSDIIEGNSGSFGNRTIISLFIPIGSETDYANAGWGNFLSVNDNISIGAKFTLNHINYITTSKNPNTVKVIGGDVSENLEIPNIVKAGVYDFSVTSIGNSAFKNKDLISVIIPNNVTNIEDSAFESNLLEHVTLSNNLEHIGLSCFISNQLKSITIPDSVTTIEESAFSENPIEKIIVIGTTPAVIDATAFGDHSIIALNTPSGTTSIYKNSSWSGFESNNEYVTLAPKIFLQGAFPPNPGEAPVMRDDLRIKGIIPNTSPYEDNARCDSSLFNAIENRAIVDWVFVELRDATDNTIIVEGKSGLLHRGGDIVSADGMSDDLHFFNAPASNDYFVVIKHRNHLSAMTEKTLTLTAIKNNIDFTNNPSIIQGGVSALTQIRNNVFGLIAGDADTNKQIQNSDIDIVVNQLGKSGYIKADLDMNGQVQNSDINSLLSPNLGKGEQF